VIKLEGVWKSFPGQQNPAVKELSMEVPAGEVCVLVGPSGCGKTTTMKMINRLIEPTAGMIYVNGRDTAALDPIKLRLDIGYVIQEIGLFPHMTVAENIATVPREKRWPADRIRARVEELLELVGLGHRLHHTPEKLSGGEQQRVAIARALVNEPAIILADEPTGNIDTRAGEEVMAIFQRLNRERGITIVLVTHEPDIARHAQRIVRLRDGLVVGEERVERPISAEEVLVTLSRGGS